MSQQKEKKRSDINVLMKVIMRWGVCDFSRGILLKTTLTLMIPPAPCSATYQSKSLTPLWNFEHCAAISVAGHAACLCSSASDVCDETDIHSKVQTPLNHQHAYSSSDHLLRHDDTRSPHSQRTTRYRPDLDSNFGQEPPHKLNRQPHDALQTPRPAFQVGLQ